MAITVFRLLILDHKKYCNFYMGSHAHVFWNTLQTTFNSHSKEHVVSIINTKAKLQLPHSGEPTVRRNSKKHALS